MKAREETAGAYSTQPLSDEEILSAAAAIIDSRFAKGESLTSLRMTGRYLKLKLAAEPREHFAILMLDARRRVLRYEVLFVGTINTASVYPREIVKAVLRENAAAVILAHNHPSGRPEPSLADEALTRRIKDALELIDVSVLDHFIVGEGDPVSFADRGLL